MHQYSEVNNPNLHSPALLALSEIKARVRVITTLSSRSFMDEDLPPPLSKDVVSTLVSLFFLVCRSPSSLLPFSSNAHFAGDQTLGAVPPAPS